MSYQEALEAYILKNHTKDGEGVKAGSAYAELQGPAFQGCPTCDYGADPVSVELFWLSEEDLGKYANVPEYSFAGFLEELLEAGRSV